MEYIDGFRNAEAAAVLRRDLIDELARLEGAHRRVCIMEVCGTHTVAIARSGIRDILPPSLDLVSGPGCPVCVTEAGYIDAAIKLAGQGKIIVTFADMLRVPGSDTSLEQCRSAGGRVEVCYSPLEALTLAEKNPGDQVVFLAVGFETTTAPALGLLMAAECRKAENLSLLTAFKTVPQALAALSSSSRVRVDGFLLPAHVSAVIGSRIYNFLPERFRKPGVVAGFEPLDILYALREIVRMLVSGKPAVINQYDRVVKPAGNEKILECFRKYLEPVDARWRGLGVIPQSGLGLRSEYLRWDAAKRFGVDKAGGKNHPGCRCGEVLEGALKPPACPLFGKACTPRKPVGPCMVSSEGTCAAWYKYVAVSKASKGMET